MFDLREKVATVADGNGGIGISLANGLVRELPAAH